MNQSFSLKRIGWLSKKEFYESLLPHFKILSIIVSAIVLIRCIVEFFESSNESVGHNFSYEGIFIVFGFIYTINSFEELKTLPTRASFLTLPATAAEKIFTKWLFANIIFWLGVTVLYTVFYLLQILIVGVLMGKQFDDFELFTITNFQGLHYLIILLSVFFYGAVAFNTGSWYKIILRIIILSLAFLLILTILAYAIFPELRALTNGNMPDPIGNSIELDLLLKDFWVFKLSKYILLYLVAPFFWFMSYLKLKEKEV